MAETTRKKQPATVLQNMDKAGFAKILANLKDEHEAASEASKHKSGAYAKMKKQGVNAQALQLVQKLHMLGSAVKVQTFLADFERMCELAGFNDQLALFEEDKTKAQKTAESAAVAGNVVQHPASAKTKQTKAEKKAAEAAAKAQAKKTAKAEKAARAAKGAIPAPDESAPAEAPAQPLPSTIPQGEAPTRAKLFSEEGDEPAEEAATDEQRAYGAGHADGHAGKNYANPHSVAGPLRDAWHKGWVQGDELREAEEKQRKAG